MRHSVAALLPQSPALCQQADKAIDETDVGGIRQAAAGTDDFTRPPIPRQPRTSRNMVLLNDQPIRAYNMGSRTRGQVALGAWTPTVAQTRATAATECRCRHEALCRKMIRPGALFKCRHPLRTGQFLHRMWSIEEPNPMTVELPSSVPPARPSTRILGHLASPVLAFTRRLPTVH